MGNMTNSWYVLHSKPRKERVFWRYLQSQDIDCYFPHLLVNPVNPRAQRVKPYFPGYLFVFCDLDQLGNNAFRWMPHSLGLVRFDGQPAVVPENLIHGIRNTIAAISMNKKQPIHDLQPGDPVKITAGPFSGYRAVLDMHFTGKERVCVLLQMLGEVREIPLELSAAHIRKG